MRESLEELRSLLLHAKFTSHTNKTLDLQNGLVRLMIELLLEDGTESGKGYDPLISDVRESPQNHC